MENSNNINEIDKKINEAKARQAKQGKSTQVNDKAEKPKATRKRLSPEDREARDKAREEAKAQKRQEREVKRAKKLAEREANKKPAHMKKIEKVIASLPEMNETTQSQYDGLKDVLTTEDLDTLVQHLMAHVRMERTKQALERTVEVGDTVRIVGGPAKFVGAIGTVVKAQRIRCYVQVPGHDKDIYLFISDTEEVAEGTQVENSETSDEVAVEA